MKIDMKYELIKDDFIEIKNKKLFRIRALKNFSNIKAGSLGGYIQKEDNLSQYGNSWIFDNARVFSDAWVSDNAKIYDKAWVYDNARVFGGKKK